jgi:hypothetical protein
MSIADDIRAAAFSCDPAPIEDIICTVLMTDAEVSLANWNGEQYRTFMLIVAESFDDRERREHLEAALRGLHDDIAEYQRINNLGGFDNHWMRAARAALSKAGSTT